MFNEFPYANFNEYNLDWLIRRYKELTKLTGELSDKVEAELKFIQAEIMNRLQELVTNGTFADILSEIALDGRNVTGKYIESSAPITEEYAYDPDIESMTSTEVYSFYNDLMARYGGITREEGTPVEGGQPWLYYRMQCVNSQKSQLYLGVPVSDSAYDSSAAYTNNQLVIFSGVHGNEKQTVYTLMHIIKGILEDKNPLFEYIHNNINLIVVPCVNPWGIDNNSRYDANGVDINRNFDVSWSTYADNNPNCGTSVASEIATQNVVRLLRSIASDKRHLNGTVIIDLHDFRGETADYSDFYTIAYATEPRLKIELTKSTIKLQQMIKDFYPEIDARYSRPVRVVNIQNAPTLINWAYNIGFRYALLNENRIRIDGISTYSTITNTTAWYSLTLAVASIASMFVGHKKSYYMDSLQAIGINTNSDAGYNLQNVIDAMPRNSKLTLSVSSSINSGLYADMPKSNLAGTTHYAGTLEIEKTGDTGVITLLYTVNSASNPYKYKAIAQYSSGGYTIGEWQLIDNATMSLLDFPENEFPPATITLQNLIDTAFARKERMIIFRTRTANTALLAEMPTNTYGTLVIIASRVTDAIRGGLMFYSLNNGDTYISVITPTSTTAWKKITTT